MPGAELQARLDEFDRWVSEVRDPAEASDAKVQRWRAGRAWAEYHPETFIRWLREARRAALELWFDEESAPDLSRLPIRRKQQKSACVRGHQLSDDNVGRHRAKGRNRIVCLQCKRDARRAAA